MAVALRPNVIDAPLGHELAAPAFAAAVERVDDGVRVELRGELDAFAAAALRRRMLELVHRHEVGAVIVDLARLTFIDASGLTVLLVVQREVARRGGGFVLLGAADRIRRLLRITGLDNVFTIR